MLKGCKLKAEELVDLLFSSLPVTCTTKKKAKHVSQDSTSRFLPELQVCNHTRSSLQIALHEALHT